MKKIKNIYILLIFIAGCLFGIGLLAVNRLFLSTNIIYADTYGTNTLENALSPDENSYFKYYRMFSEGYNVIKKEFYDEKMVSSSNLWYGAMKGMLDSLNDPYSMFMDPSAAKEFSIDVTASFGGLGLEIDMKDGDLLVVSPIEDTPAWKAGIKPGDKIIEIEGVSTKGMSVKDATDKLRGNIGTKITITLQREGLSEPFRVTMTREEIKIKTVKSDTIDYGNKKYGYIKILEFSVPTADEFKKQLRDELAKNPAGLVIDLRNNPGGLLSVVADCVNYFLNEGIIVYTKGRVSDNNQEFSAKKDEAFVPRDLPLVVLINQGSASASEIFAGAMQDTGRGVLVGMKSFGKGSVQKTYTFPEDGAEIKYTVARYYTPSGVCIDKIGLTPNVQEKLWYENLSDDEKTAIVKLENSGLIREFLNKNGEITDEKTKEFRKDLASKGFNISEKSLGYLVLMIKTEDSSIPPVYELTYDNQLVKGLYVLQDYLKYKKPFKVFMEEK